MWQHFPSDQRINLQTVVPAMSVNLWGAGRDEGLVADTVVGEAIVCPLAGRGKVEFPVFLYVDRSNEGFAAGMQPEVIFSRCWLFAGEQDIAGIAVKVVIHRQVSIFDQPDTGFNRADCCTGGRSVALQ